MKTMTKPANYKLRLLSKKNLATDFWLFEFEKPKGLEYEAGQFMSIKVDESGVRRSYSIASYPQMETLELLVDIKPMGVGSVYLSGLKPAEQIEVMMPMGHFVFGEAEPVRKLLFMGTGSGIVPLRSMVLDLLETKKEKRAIRLNWGLRFEADIFWKKEFEELEEKYDNFEFDFVLSKPSLSWQGCGGHVGDCLLEHKVDLNDVAAYLCGGKEMVVEMQQFLLKQGVSAGRIHFERFW